MKRRNPFTILLALGLVISPLENHLKGEVRIKDITTIENAEQTSLVGYGLVVGLNRTGDRSITGYGAVFTVQSISNMLERFGITVPKKQLRTRNVAAVMVTGKTPIFGRVGSSFDVIVSSLGDASSLEGGVLLMTPLRAADGTYYGYAQGPVSIGGFNVETTAGEKYRRNHALVGRVPNGGVLERATPPLQLDKDHPLRLLLREPDFVTASRIADVINAAYAPDGQMRLAKPLNAGVVQVDLPPTFQQGTDGVFFISAIETLKVQPDMVARVVINERTGTIVAGADVRISEVMISHGALTIHIQQQPVISQPQAPFSNTGRTVVTAVTKTTVTEEGQTAVLPANTSVGDLAAALNQLGLKPRDVIAIFQAIKEAGALNAELVIL